MLSEATSEKVNLQKRLNELYQERKDLIRNIKTITRRKRLISDNLK
jgi:chromosome segregation ATPase